MRRSQPSPQSPSTVRKSKPDHTSVIRRTISTAVDNLNIDMCLLNELKNRCIINDHIVIDVLCRPNRPAKVLCFSEHMLALGPYAIRECGVAMVKCGYKILASILQQMVLEERDRAGLSQLIS